MIADYLNAIVAVGGLIVIPSVIGLVKVYFQTQTLRRDHDKLEGRVNSHGHELEEVRERLVRIETKIDLMLTKNGTPHS